MAKAKKPRKTKADGGVPLREVGPPPEGSVWRLWRVPEGETPSCVACGAPAPFYTAELPAGHSRADYHPPLLFAEVAGIAGPEFVDPATALHGSMLVVVAR